MKKYLFPALALGLVMTSCQSDEPFAPGEGGEKQVTFTLNVPGELGTRAATGNNSGVGGLSNNAGELSYTLVLDANGDQRTFTKTGAGSVVFNPTVVLGREYTVTAYAHFGNAWDGETAIDITKHFNDETKDAYFKQENIKFELNKTSKQIILQRPFGKLRLLATDYTAAGTELNTAVESVIIEYLDREAAAFNPIKKIFTSVDKDNNGEADEYVNIEQPQTFGYYAAEEDGAMPIFADYIPANSEDNMVDFTVTVKYKNADNAQVETYSRTFSDIPVRRNALTTLSGNFFTAGAEITVEVDDNFENDIPDKDNEKEQLIIAAAMGGEVTLTKDVVLDAPLNVQANMVLNLNGKTISAEIHKNVGPVIKNNGTLTISGGTISSTADNGGSAIQNNGTLVIEDATLNGAPNADGGWPSYTVNNTGTMTAENVKITSYHGAVASYGKGEGSVVTLNNCEIDMAGIPGFTSHGIYTYNDGKVVVNGGTYANKATDQNASGASVINGAVEVNAGTFSGRIENYYGTPVLKGGTYSVNPKASFIATGYKAVEKDGKYYVVPEEADAVATTSSELLGSIKVADQTVYLMPTADGSTLLLEGKMSLGEGVSLIGYGDTPVGVFNDWGSNAFANQAHFTNTTIENIAFDNNLVIDAGIANGKVNFKNCVFGGHLAHQGVHFDSGNATIVFENCTFVGRNMFGASLTKVIFNNCTFLNKKSSQTGADKWTGVNMWGKYEFNNCEFDTEATCNVKCDGVEAVFNNCKYTDNRDVTTVVKNSNNYNCNIEFK